MNEAQTLGEKLASFRSTLSDSERGLLDRIFAAASQSKEVPEVETFGFGLGLDPGAMLQAAAAAAKGATIGGGPIPDPPDTQSTAQALRG
jgi:hypothetical protein